MAEQQLPFDPSPQKKLRLVHCAGCEAYEQQMREMAIDKEAAEADLRRLRRKVKHLEDERERKIREHEDIAIAEEIFAFWMKVCEKHPRTMFGPKRQAAVIHALALLRKRYNDDADHAPRALCCAIVGCARRGFVDDSGKRQDDLELICRDDKKIDMNLTRYRDYMVSIGKEPVV